MISNFPRRDGERKRTRIHSGLRCLIRAGKPSPNSVDVICGRFPADFFREIYTSTDDQLFRSELEVGQKYGWWDNELHSAAVVYAGRPYALAVLTGWGERTEEDERELQEIFDLVESFFPEAAEG